MKVQKTIEVPAMARTVVDHLVCDLCGKKSEGDNWSGRGYDVSDTRIEMTTGTNYGTDGGDLETTSIDVCPDCFVSKLLPWAASHGAKPHVKKTDW